MVELNEADVTSAPVVDDDGRFLSQASIEQLRTMPGHVVIATTSLIEATWSPVHERQHLDVVIEALAAWGAHWLAVVDAERRVIGTVGVTDVVRAYRTTVREQLAAAIMSGNDSGLVDVHISDSSPLVGASLKTAPLPSRVFILSLERLGTVMVPTGDNAFEVETA